MIYDIQTFIRRNEDKDLLEMIDAANREVIAAEAGSVGVKGAIAKREAGSLKYAGDLKELLFFLRNGIKPFGAGDSLFCSFKPLCEKLVNKNQFKPEILALFAGCNEEISGS